MTGRPYEAYLFDLDGTLVDTVPDIDQALNHALATVGLARVDLSLTRHWIGHGSRTLIKQALEYQQQAAAEPDIDQLTTPFLDYYKANIAVHSRTYAEVNEALSTLHQRGTKLAVVTNKLTELSEPLLQDIGLYEFFDLIVCGDTASKKTKTRSSSDQSMSRAICPCARASVNGRRFRNGCAGGPSSLGRCCLHA